MTGLIPRRRPRGFTLIEVLVTLAVFSTTSLLAVNLFVLFLQHQRRTISQVELQNDARSAIEEMAQDLRSGILDYEYYEAQSPGTRDSTWTKLYDPLDGQGADCLVIRSSLNEQIRYRLNTGILERLAPTAPTTQACDDGALTGWLAITPAALHVGSFAFTATPSEDPFASAGYETCTLDADCRWGTTCTGTFCSPQQFANILPIFPKVTFSLHVSRTANQQTVEQTFQTTVASRVLKSMERRNQYVP